MLIFSRSVILFYNLDIFSKGPMLDGFTGSWFIWAFQVSGYIIWLIVYLEPLFSLSDGCARENALIMMPNLVKHLSVNQSDVINHLNL